MKLNGIDLIVTNWEKFFYWYGPDVSDEDDEITLQQYKDYNELGIYKDRKEY